MPLRVFGEGIAIPGANASPTIAADAAWRLLQEQLALVAPGARLDDFALVANTAHGGLRGSLPMRTVAFAQHHDGAPVLGASVGFLFKNDRMFVISSTAAPRLPGSTPRTSVGAALAGTRATAWLGRATGLAVAVRASDETVRWLPLHRATGALDARAVISVEVETLDPATPGRWQVYVDAVTGAPVARTSLLKFATGTITYRVPARSPQRPRIDAPATFAAFRVGATAAPPSS